jgi:hypothetical protein
MKIRFINARFLIWVKILLVLFLLVYGSYILNGFKHPYEFISIIVLILAIMWY